MPYRSSLPRKKENHFIYTFHVSSSSFSPTCSSTPFSGPGKRGRAVFVLIAQMDLRVQRLQGLSTPTFPNLGRKYI
jgi:hypothetical protein